MQLLKKLRIRDRRRYFQHFFTFFEKKIKAGPHPAQQSGATPASEPSITLNPANRPVKKIVPIPPYFFAA